MMISRLSSHANRAITSICVCLALALASSARAELKVYEGFDYTVGNLAGAAGGTGFAAGSSWGLTGGPAAVQAGSLGYTDANGKQLVTSGNSAMISGASGTNAQVVRALADTYSEGTTWWSFVGVRLEPHATDPSLGDNVNRAASLQIRNGSSERLAVGKGTTAANAQTNWSILHSGAVANAVYSTESVLTQSFLLVRIDHFGDSSAFDDVWLWVNPLLDAEPSTVDADARFENIQDFTFNGLRMFAGNTTSPNLWAEMALDEIRIGTTYDSVTPYVTGGGFLEADFNQDGVVSPADLTILQTNYGTGTTNAQGDADGDHAVGGADYLIWQRQYNAAAPSTGAIGAVPEPATLGLALVLAAAALPLRRRR